MGAGKKYHPDLQALRADYEEGTLTWKQLCAKYGMKHNRTLATYLREAGVIKMARTRRRIGNVVTIGMAPDDEQWVTVTTLAALQSNRGVETITGIVNAVAANLDLNPVPPDRVKAILLKLHF